MQIQETTIAGARLIVPTLHRDHRGAFVETFRASTMREIGLDLQFVQENVSQSVKGVLRGMHHAEGMAKLSQVVYGRTYHVIADMRPDSPSYLRWQAFTLSHENGIQVFVPPGVANGFYVMSDFACIHYKQTRYYDPSIEQRVRWNDPLLGIQWPSDSPILSDQDRDIPDCVVPAADRS